MYKLLLVSDQEEVLNAFARIQNWELLGFKQPHIRHDFEGTKDSLAKHHADGICIAVNPDQEELILAYLQENYPNVSIFEAGRSEEEVLRYLSELKILLNRIHADFYNERSNTRDVLQMCRHEFFRKVINGKIRSSVDLHRNMRLLRSRMDADRPCLLIELGQSVPYDKLEGRWHYGDESLEIALRTSFAGDLNGIHILPTIHSDGRILVLACPLHGVDTDMTVDTMTAMLTSYTADSIEHMKEYFGLELHITEIRVFPALTALCGNTDEA
jgi:hypothetical protein